MSEQISDVDHPGEQSTRDFNSEQTDTAAKELADYQIFQNYNHPFTADTQLSDEEEYQERYPSWTSDNGKPIKVRHIKSIFNDLTTVFGFQEDNRDNMFDFFLCQLESRSSRMSCKSALVSLHSEYIGGDLSNYKKWYFIAHFELDEGQIENSMWCNYYQYLKSFKARDKNRKKSGVNGQTPFLGMDFNWKSKMSKLTCSEYVEQLALFLLIWGEANNIRFMPECLCFIFKCCLDHYNSSATETAKIPSFMDQVITPLYLFIRNQQYKLLNGKWVKNSKDHDSIIGYDDINQFFWFSSNLLKIKLKDGTSLYSFAKHKRLENFKEINWKACLYKTYKEKRTWNHLVTNYSRIWIIHISMFWYYTSFNSTTLYTVNYNFLVDNSPAPQVQLTIMSLGSSLACIVSIFATIFEFQFVPRKWPGAQRLVPKLICLILLTVVNTSPTVYILGFIPLDKYSIHGFWISVAQFVFSIITFLYLAIVPPSLYFSPILKTNWNHIKSLQFTSSVTNMKFKSKLMSLSIWILVFVLKFFESYVFLTLSLRDPIRALATMDLSRCKGDIILGTILCKYEAKVLLILLYLTDLVLFFLDTYLWYIIVNCCFSIGLSLNLGVSTMQPWRNIFIRLPERIFTKLVFESKKLDLSRSYSVAQIWNAVVLSLYRDHMISLEQMNKLIYQFFEKGELSYIDPQVAVKAPNFFMLQDDNSFNLNDFFSCGKEAERRIGFFAQSLTCTLPNPIPTKAVPSFTVLIPHYSEKILMELKELIKESRHSKVSVLDYLKQLNPLDWERFVQDTRILNNMSATSAEPQFNSGALSFPGSASASASAKLQDKFDEIPYYYIGFKNSDSEYTLRTRIWASLRSQTLYRTVSGFMNYENALKILYKSEDMRFSIQSDIYQDESENELTRFVQRKFRLLISLQRYQQFNDSELENVRLLVESFPNIQISYLETSVDETSNEIIYYSTLLDLKNMDSIGNFIKKFRIRLSGNPILGDGKSDNQNNSVIFYRGEYIQVVDANQDNYIEECLKIKAVLSEFEEYNINIDDNYNPEFTTQVKSPVAIVGAREYIFSENIGVLGDLAAAKEQTFGTLFARTLAEIGGKLHYGHPDFLHGIFMTTRGGVSKAQKGLHLNEDIYAGMTAMCRGGRIKHCDYYQCGKGRDLGFNTVSNFTVKIGAGMGEQMLSREHYYLGTSLPIDRFLSFYYAHAGFHINNLFISLSALLFMLVLLNLGSLSHETVSCNFDIHQNITAIKEPLGCYDLQPVLNWISSFVLSVSVCFFISFLPLIIQEIIEKGPLKAFLRVASHLGSLSPIFEVFACQIYAKSLSESISKGDAKYMATGRGFATCRYQFNYLFTRYSYFSIYYGSTLFLTLSFACLTIWQVSLLWFFISFVSMCLAPFYFNPHQFSWKQFFIDYRETIRWFSRGNSRWHNNSWYGYQKLMRLKELGCKKKPKNENITAIYEFRRENRIIHKVFDLVIQPAVFLFFNLTAYVFINSQTGVRSGFRYVNPLLRITIISSIPILLNLAILIILFFVSCFFGPILQFRKFGGIIAGVAHFLSVLICLTNVNVLMYTESWNWSRTLCGFITILAMQKFMKGFVYLFLSKEVKDDSPNFSWWSGKWMTSGLGLLILTQPQREFIIKIIELNQFAYDFILVHCLLFCLTPMLFIPYIDKMHTMTLFWSKHTKASYHSPIISKRQRIKRNWLIFGYAILYFVIMAFLSSMIIIPPFLKTYVPDISKIKAVPQMMKTLIQPNNQQNNDTGSNIPPSFITIHPVESPMQTIF